MICDLATINQTHFYSVSFDEKGRELILIEVQNYCYFLENVTYGGLLALRFLNLDKILSSFFFRRMKNYRLIFIPKSLDYDVHYAAKCNLLNNAKLCQ